MKIILKIPADIPEKTLNELAKRAAEELVNDDRDLVPVVRCKDCKYRNVNYVCTFHGEPFMDDDFCSKGVRRSET